jgi:ribosome-associated protein
MKNNFKRVISLARLLEAKHADGLLILKLSGLTSYTDYLIICSGSSSRQIESLVDEVKNVFEERPTYISGSAESGWWILDFIDIVVHVFLPELQYRYVLESIWGDAPKIVF